LLGRAQRRINVAQILHGQSFATVSGEKRFIPEKHAELRFRDPIHGHQEGGFFHGHHDCSGFAAAGLEKSPDRSPRPITAAKSGAQSRKITLGDWFGEKCGPANLK